MLKLKFMINALFFSFLILCCWMLENLVRSFSFLFSIRYLFPSFAIQKHLNDFTFIFKQTKLHESNGSSFSDLEFIIIKSFTTIYNLTVYNLNQHYRHTVILSSTSTGCIVTHILRYISWESKINIKLETVLKSRRELTLKCWYGFLYAARACACAVKMMLPVTISFFTLCTYFR